MDLKWFACSGFEFMQLFLTSLKLWLFLGVVVHSWNPSTQKAEVVGSRVQGQSGLQGLYLVSIKKKKKKCGSYFKNLEIVCSDENANWIRYITYSVLWMEKDGNLIQSGRFGLWGYFNNELTDVCVSREVNCEENWLNRETVLPECSRCNLCTCEELRIIAQRGKQIWQWHRRRWWMWKQPS
jgi:hypothetical protein